MTLTAGVVVAGTAVHTALSSGDVAVRMGKSLADAGPDVSSLVRATVGVAIEALGGPSSRRNSSNGPRHWIEVRGLGGEHRAAIAIDVVAAVRATPGVRTAFLNRHLARLVVTLDTEADEVPTTADLCRIVADAEQLTEPAVREHRTACRVTTRC